MDLTMTVMAKKAIVLYYSLDGNTRFLAQSLAHGIRADIQRLQPVRDISPASLLKIPAGAWQAIRKKTPRLEPLEFPPDLYRILFIGTPVWAGTCAPAVRTLLQEKRFQDKKIAFFCSHGGGKGRVFEEMKQLLPGNEILGQIDFVNPLRNKEPEKITEKIVQWANFLFECLDEERKGPPE
jgi:flavodoxin